ncbi:alpha/beta hydrolase [Acidicapsa dinghuensis]|uniref:Alpha/beta hydrolase n=1 Tax=Acidicapsa dinghuensis TaxID=2218256 RepID=A0ABW1EK93_9BACT|nr:alpha/beta family hydrolase [Acidicapsa dinghuensis]
MPAVSNRPEQQSAFGAPDQPHPGTNAPSIRSVELHGPAGRLEALLNEGHPDAKFVSLVCHPHPLGGGTMHNKVVYHAAKVFHGFGWPVLRFNFRGAGLSEGEHDGSSEFQDVQTALDWLTLHYDKPIIAAGFSFGAAMGLAACCGNASIHGFAALGLPSEAQGRHYRYPMLAECAMPKLFLSGDRDQFATPDQLRMIIASAAEPKTFVLIPGADHFFFRALPAMQEALRSWILTSFPALFPDRQSHISGKPADSATSAVAFESNHHDRK